jgi:ABC-type branched-subunit amino acid transport system substrate-binding protein
MNRHQFLRTFAAAATLSMVSAGVFAAGKDATKETTKTPAGDEFRILHVAPYSGNLQSTGSWLRDALKAYAKDMQQNGFPRKIVIKEFDDEYKPEKTLSIAMQQAQEFRPHAMFGMVGTANLKTLVDKKFFDNNDFPLIGVRTGAPIYHPKVVHLRASYAAEVIKMMEFSALQGFDRIGVIYQNDDFGLDGLAAAQAYVEKNKNIQLVAKAPYTRNTTEVDAAVTAMTDNNVNSVIIVGNTNANAAVVEKIKKSGQKIALSTVSVVDPGQTVQKIKNLSQGLIVAQVVPGLYDSRFPLAADFRKFAERHKLPANSTVFEGYVMARTLFDGASRLKGPMNGPALLKEIRSKPVNYGGFRLNLPDVQRTTTFVDTMIIGSKNEFYY